MVSVLARRETLIAAGLFDEQLRSVEDFDLWLRVIKQGGQIGYHRDVLTRYRRHSASLSADPVWMCQHVLKVLDKAAQTLSLAAPEKSCLNQNEPVFTRCCCFRRESARFSRRSGSCYQQADRVEPHFPE